MASGHFLCYIMLPSSFHTDVVHSDLKSTMRVLYSLFNKYKSTVTSQSETAAEKKWSLQWHKMFINIHIVNSILYTYSHLVLLLPVTPLSCTCLGLYSSIVQRCVLTVLYYNAKHTCTHTASTWNPEMASAIHTTDIQTYLITWDIPSLLIENNGPLHIFAFAQETWSCAHIWFYHFNPNQVLNQPLPSSYLAIRDVCNPTHVLEQAYRANCW